MLNQNDTIPGGTMRCVASKGLLTNTRQ